MKNTSYCEREIEKIKNERDSWKETALVVETVKGLIAEVEMKLIEQKVQHASEYSATP